MNRASIVLALALGLLLPAAPSYAQERAAAPKLTIEAARERKSRVREVAYGLRFELDGEAAEFSGSVNIAFELSGMGEDLTVDFTGGTVAAVAINGERVDADYNGFYLTLPAAALQAGQNQVQIAFAHPYSTDGSGLYRFRDPEDGRDYLYTDFEPYDQNRLFPSFDQPDLKARYATEVTVPASWQVISIVAESQVTQLGERRTWTFPQSAPISTYIYALHAGDYHVWEAVAGDIPLRLFARESLARYVNAEDWFLFTQQGFDFFASYFEVPYPFGKYDQVIVPHFNAGAMENVGAVTFSERYLRRGTVTRRDRFGIASVILHEMAHMWFGDLVTMDWWNGLWLNESFATFMATLAMAEGTEFTEAWENAYRSTVRAYLADERDTTHAIELPVPDTDAAFANFDAITYNKGSATLTQLNYLVGPEAFRRGVSQYLERHAYGNTTTEDFLAAISSASGRDLDRWAADWLHEPGTNAVRAELECRDGRIYRLALHQAAPDAWPTLRTHRAQLGLYSYEDGRFEVDTLPVTYSGARTAVPAAVGRRCPGLIYANHGDWDYARVQLSDDILPMLEGRMGAFNEALARSMLWQSVWDMVLDTRLTITQFIDFALVNSRDESNDPILRQVLGSIQSGLRLLSLMDPEGSRFAAVRSKVEEEIWRRLGSAEPGSDRQVLLFDNYVASAASPTAHERLAGMLDDDPELPKGFNLDQDRRWNVLARLTSAGFVAHPELLANESRRDPSDQGRLRAISVRASIADANRKREWLDTLLGDGANLSVAEARAAAGGLFPTEQSALQLEFAADILARLPAVSQSKPPEFFGSVVGGLLRSACNRDYLEQLEAAIETGATLHPRLFRGLKDTRFEVARCLDITAYQESAG